MIVLPSLCRYVRTLRSPAPMSSASFTWPGKHASLVARISGDDGQEAAGLDDIALPEPVQCYVHPYPSNLIVDHAPGTLAARRQRPQPGQFWLGRQGGYAFQGARRRYSRHSQRPYLLVEAKGYPAKTTAIRAAWRDQT